MTFSLYPPGSLDALELRAVGPFGPQVRVDFGVEDGPLRELAALLGRHNGFSLFNFGIQVFRAGPDGLGPDLDTWNQPTTWRGAYGPLGHDLYCFAQDLFGVQFAIEHNQRIVRFDPDTAQRTYLGSELNEWAGWLLSNPDRHGVDGFARSWQQQHGELTADQRLHPRRPFNLGGAYDDTNLVPADAAASLRARAGLAVSLRDLPNGAIVNVGHQFAVPASYRHFDLLADPDDDSPVSVLADDLDRIGIAQLSALGVWTARDGTIPVTVHVLSAPPEDDDLAGWDRVAEASIDLDDHLLILGNQDVDQAARVATEPGTYRVRVHWSGLDTITGNGLRGDDHYRIVLWQDEPLEWSREIKAYSGQLP